MKRNRSIRTLPLESLKLLKHPLPEPPYFGEQILEISPPPSSEDSLDIFLSNYHLDESKSSSSSLSWGGETKTESSRLVQAELERMDRVLRGEEPIPPNYDAEEYKEWMEFFPNLCVSATKIIICDNDTTSLDSCLQISQFTRLPRRQASSRSLISSHISASKWLKDDEINYNSLPFISGVRGERTGVPKGILKNCLILPPIEPSRVRSISATPRRESKSLSALSSKYSGFQKRV